MDLQGRGKLIIISQAKVLVSLNTRITELTSCLLLGHSVATATSETRPVEQSCTQAWHGQTFVRKLEG